MATRRRRTTTPRAADPAPVEPTHEKMLEVAAEREVETQEEEAPMEVILTAALADTFEAIQKAEEEKGVDNFFDPGFYEPEVRLPAQPTGQVHADPAPKPLLSNREPRYLTRQDRTRKYRRG